MTRTSARLTSSRQRWAERLILLSLTLLRFCKLCDVLRGGSRRLLLLLLRLMLLLLLLSLATVVVAAVTHVFLSWKNHL